MNFLKFIFVTVFVGLLHNYSQAQINVGIKTVDVDADAKINALAIEQLAFELLNTADDSLKKQLNQDLKELLILECSKPEAISHSFEEVKSLSILTSEDSVFRLFNWNIPWSDGTFDFECGLLKRIKDTDDADFYFLKSIEDSVQLTEQSPSPKNEWIPSLYYQVITKKTERLTYYTLLSWDGNNRLTTKKYIEVFWFDQAGEMRFGAPILVENGKAHKRKVFEYAAQNTLNLKFNSDLNRIEFDHLVPSNPRLAGVYEYYGADLSFDAYYWKNNRWEFESDIDIEEGINKSKKDFKVDQEIIKEKKSIYEP